jgi:hypothetical protein
MALFWLLMATAQTAGAFYCGHDLVMEGDYKLQVLQRCGEPTYAQHRVEYRTVVIRGSGIYQPGLDIIRQEPVEIDEWTYDFGPHRIMKGLYFENGRLLTIKELGYGRR